jgi:signal transduction histidine kinase
MLKDATRLGIKPPKGKPFLSETLEIEADKSRIRQVIDNLISNAIKYTAKGWVRVWLADAGETVRFYIKDTGVGIAPKDKKRLFKKFSRIKSKAQGRHVVRPGGTGLGLYVAKEILKLHKGDIKVQSRGIPGEGSLFTFHVPKKFIGIVAQKNADSLSVKKGMMMRFDDPEEKALVAQKEALRTWRRSERKR